MRPVRLCLFVLLILEIPASCPWLVQQPKENVWVTLAKTIGQSDFCLNTPSASSPLSTCLVGMPMLIAEVVGRPQNIKLTHRWNSWAHHLPSMHADPQELDLAGSAQPQFCIRFGQKVSINRQNRTVTRYGIRTPSLQVPPRRPVTPVGLEVSPNDKKLYSESKWCKFAKKIQSAPIVFRGELPKGMFLICGDRAWNGIPHNLHGGPCTIGQLSMLTPGTKQLMAWRNHTELVSARGARRRANMVHKSSSFIVRQCTYLYYLTCSRYYLLTEVSHGIFL